MSFLSKLFGGGGARPGPEPIEYEGYSIVPEPMSDAGGYRIAARIEKEIDGAVKTHKLIRADTLQSKEAADTASVNKAKQLIDEQGDRLFG